MRSAVLIINRAVTSRPHLLPEATERSEDAFVARLEQSQIMKSSFANITIQAALAAVVLDVGSAMAFDIIKHGATKVAISAGKTDPEEFAVQELVRIIKAVSGAEFWTNAAPADVPNRIVIGTPEANPKIAEAHKGWPRSIPSRRWIARKAQGHDLRLDDRSRRRSIESAQQPRAHHRLQARHGLLRGTGVPRRDYDTIARNNKG